jgi:hypothetical protein
MKILFLHGYGESATLAEFKTAQLKKALSDEGQETELLPFPNGTKKLATKTEFMPIFDPDYRQMCEDGELPAYSWYPLVKEVDDGGHRDPENAAGAKDFAFRSDAESQKQVAPSSRQPAPASSQQLLTCPRALACRRSRTYCPSSRRRKVSMLSSASRREASSRT